LRNTTKDKFHVRSINESVKICIAPVQDTYSEAHPTQAKRKRQSWEGGGIENKHRLGGALDLLEDQSRLLDQPQKMNDIIYSDIVPLQETCCCLSV